MSTKEEKIQMIDIDKILVPEERVTSIVDSETLAELEQSIKERGILQPLYLMNIDGKLILVDGLHRLLVAKKLRIKKVPCIVKKGTEKDLLIENLIVNRQRGISDPVGEAIVLKTLIEEHKMSIYQAAKAVNISESTARKYLQILKLSQEILDMVRRKELSLGCAYWISKLQDKELQYQTARDAVAFGYTEEMCRARVLQLLRPDLEPEDVGYTFTPEGAPERVLPKCWLCGKEIEDDPVYIWLHKSCLETMNQIMSEIETQEQANMQQEKTMQTQQTQQILPQTQIPQPQISQQQTNNISKAQQTETEWIWLDDCTLVNKRTREIRRIC